MYKVAVIIPDRNDRPELTENCFRMLRAQTVAPSDIYHINYPAKNNSIDITERYRTAYQQINYTNKEIDLIAFIENDDYYHPKYLETMISLWENAGKPDLLGLNHTMYYHIYLKKYFIMKHKIRSSAMNTIIAPGLDIKWCADDQAYTDIHLWLGDANINGKKIIIPAPKDEICIGIKHGIGLPGGFYHNNHLDKFIHDDSDSRVLEYFTDPKSFQFYKMMYDKYSITASTTKH